MFKDAMGSDILNLIGNSCGGQNKNQYMNALAAKLANSKSPLHIHFGKVNMKFPWPGHMFLLNDGLFGVFTKYFRGKKVYEPHQLLQLIHISAPNSRMDGLPCKQKL